MASKFLLSITTVLIFCAAGLSCSLTEDRKTARGNEIVRKVEDFKKEKGRLPESLSEIGIEEKLEGPIYYRKESGEKFILWFGTSLGESVKYDSDSKQWK